MRKKLFIHLGVRFSEKWWIMIFSHEAHQNIWSLNCWCLSQTCKLDANRKRKTIQIIFSCAFNAINRTWRNLIVSFNTIVTRNVICTCLWTKEVLFNCFVCLHKTGLRIHQQPWFYQLNLKFKSWQKNDLVYLNTYV